MNYYARFREHSKAVFRFDTRIYLRHRVTPEPNDLCIGAIVAKNPGSAVPAIMDRLSPLLLNGDKMLPTVRNRFISAYRHAGKPVPEGAFVQVWNLFYLCGADLRAALRQICLIPSPPVCSSEITVPPMVWFAWGNSHRNLNPLKARFQQIQPACAFFYDENLQEIVARVPRPADFAKHPQGLLETPIVNFLASKV